MAPFRVGLVLSGGATAGSYTAGVIDFLFEALEEWEKERRINPKGTPCWEIKIDNMTASSAGAIVTMLSAVTLGTDHQPLSRNFTFGDPTPEKNLLYRSWVSEFGPDMFSNADLPAIELESSEVHPIRSIANSTYMRGMANKMCLPVVPTREIPQWANEMKIFLTITNMNGVPYSIEMCDSLNMEDRKFLMHKHSDCVGFGTSGATDSSLFDLNLGNPRNYADWQRLYDVAAGSASVPLLFPTIDISRPYGHYKNSSVITPGTSPDWHSTKRDTIIYNFPASDGGLFNNEPIEICRKSLEESAKKKLCPTAHQSWGACILIDCNSNTSHNQAENLNTKTSLVECASRLFLVMMNESGFKYSDFFEAMNTENCSQFIISPTRQRKKRSEPILATSTMGLFGGLLDERMRHHDFLLGRRNCQEFLRQHFTMDTAHACQNEIFFGLSTRRVDHNFRTPIIPLFGSAIEDCPMPEWPQFTEEEKIDISRKFRIQVCDRLRAIFTTYARNIGLLSTTSKWNFVKKSRVTFVRLVVNLISMLAYRWLDRIIQEALKHF